VAGTVLALQDAAELLDLDPGLEAWRVDLLERRREENVYAGLLREPRVALLVARVALEVLAFGELGRIDEQADDDLLVLRTGCPEQREMPFVEGAHRRYQADRIGPRELGCRAHDLHLAVASASTS